MKKFGIIAFEDERISRLKWYRRKTYKITEHFIVEDFEAEAVTFYIGRNSLKHLPKLLLENDIVNAVLTERFIKKIGNISIESILISNGEKIFLRLLPSLTKKIFKLSGIEGKSGTLAVSEDNPTIALSVIEALCNDFRYITIITKHHKKACEIASKILDEYGLPITIVEYNSKIKCDIAVKTGSNLPNLTKNSILIDASCENTITRKNSINWANVYVNHNLPFKIDSLSLIECFENITNSVINCRISAFRCGENIISTSSLCKGTNNEN